MEEHYIPLPKLVSKYPHTSILATSFFQPKTLNVLDCENEEDKLYEQKKSEDPLAVEVWRLYTKAKDNLPQGQRLENLTWRMMAVTLSKNGNHSHSKKEEYEGGKQEIDSSESDSEESLDLFPMDTTSPLPHLAVVKQEAFLEVGHAQALGYNQACSSLDILHSSATGSTVNDYYVNNKCATYTYEGTCHPAFSSRLQDSSHEIPPLASVDAPFSAVAVSRPDVPASYPPVGELENNGLDFPTNTAKRANDFRGSKEKNTEECKPPDASRTIPTSQKSSNSRNGLNCANCETTVTPLWRRGPDGTPLCNACGLFFKLHGIMRPRSLKSNVIRRRNRQSTATSSSSVAGCRCVRATAATGIRKISKKDKFTGVSGICATAKLKVEDKQQSGGNSCGGVDIMSSDCNHIQEDWHSSLTANDTTLPSYYGHGTAPQVVDALTAYYTSSFPRGKVPGSQLNEHSLDLYSNFYDGYSVVPNSADDHLILQMFESHLSGN